MNQNRLNFEFISSLNPFELKFFLLSFTVLVHRALWLTFLVCLRSRFKILALLRGLLLELLDLSCKFKLLFLLFKIFQALLIDCNSWSWIDRLRIWKSLLRDRLRLSKCHNALTSLLSWRNAPGRLSSRLNMARCNKFVKPLEFHVFTQVEILHHFVNRVKTVAHLRQLATLVCIKHLCAEKHDSGKSLRVKHPLAMLEWLTVNVQSLNKVLMHLSKLSETGIPRPAILVDLLSLDMDFLLRLK